MRVPYDYTSSISSCKEYYDIQNGSGLPYFSGPTIQRGYGFGSLISRVFKGSVLPIFKRGAQAVGKQLLSSGASILSDVMNGKNLKAAAKDNLLEGGKKVINDLTQALVKPKNTAPARPKKRKANYSSPHPQLRQHQTHNKKRKTNMDIFT